MVSISVTKRADQDTARGFFTWQCGQVETDGVNDLQQHRQETAFLSRSAFCSADDGLSENRERNLCRPKWVVLELSSQGEIALPTTLCSLAGSEHSKIAG